ncbi:hypothetical protein A2U01_0097364, partial [Trifolium medium]|nr:hypothetical protein [Trifolium medium]
MPSLSEQKRSMATNTQNWVAEQ